MISRCGDAGSAHTVAAGEVALFQPAAAEAPLGIGRQQGVAGDSGGLVCCAQRKSAGQGKGPRRQAPGFRGRDPEGAAFPRAARASGFGLGVRGSGLCVPGSELGVQGCGLCAPISELCGRSSGLGAQGSGPCDPGSGLGVQGAGLCDRSSELGAQGSRLCGRGSGLCVRSSGLGAQGSGLCEAG